MTDIVDRLRSEYPDMKDAQDGANEIVRLRVEIKEIEKQNEELKNTIETWKGIQQGTAQLLEKFSTDNHRMREALKPFADRLSELEKVPNAAKYGASTDVDLVYLRRAREVLGENE